MGLQSGRGQEEGNIFSTEADLPWERKFLEEKVGRQVLCPSTVQLFSHILLSVFSLLLPLSLYLPLSLSTSVPLSLRPSLRPSLPPSLLPFSLSYFLLIIAERRLGRWSMMFLHLLSTPVTSHAGRARVCSASRTTGLCGAGGQSERTDSMRLTLRSRSGSWRDARLPRATQSLATSER
eukprot:748492-Hanusia_phi.AAC.2